MSDPIQLDLIDVGPRTRRRRPPVYAFTVPPSPAAMRRPGYLVWRALQTYGPQAAKPLGVILSREHGMDPHAVTRALNVALSAGHVVTAEGQYVAVVR